MGPRRRRGSLRMFLGAGVGGVMLISACSGGDDQAGDGGDDVDELAALAEGAESADWEVRSGVGVITVGGAEPEQPLTLYGDDGEALGTTPADDQGRAHIAYVTDEPRTGTLDDVIAEGDVVGEALPPGKYVLRDDSQDPPLVSDPLTVLSRDDVPDESFYEDQELEGVRMDVLGSPVEGAELTDGYQYIEMRDGVTLSAMVRFPDESLYGEGPWPTVVEISGYSPSNPEGEEPGARLARSFGYATVSVNLRGSGCSGGVFDTFNPAQMADGYDVIEAVARQPWVLNNQVGMIGLSYSGITQLYTAATAPPSLAAITAQSVIADPWLQQWPGGLYNEGFTRQWLDQRSAESAPGGSSWVQDRIDAGDEVCENNVAEHELSPDFAAFARALEMRPESADDRDLRELVGEIDTAVLLTGAFQDEQTGAQFGALLDGFDSAEILRVNMWNGRHPDGFSTMNLMDVFEFLELYVAERTPQMPDFIRAAAGAEVAGFFGYEEGELAPNRLLDQFGDDYEAALAFYEDEDPVKVVFGNGLGDREQLGAPGGTDRMRFASWPPADAAATAWYLQPDGALADGAAPDGDAAPGEQTQESFTFDPAAREVPVLAGEYGVTDALPEFDWTRFPDGKSLSFETAPLGEDALIAGPGYLELWVEVTSGDGEPVADADVQVAVSEVRPNGTELLLQNGWLRLGHRAEDTERSTDLEVVHQFTDQAYQPLDGEAVQARVAIPSLGHELAEGSRLRVTLSSPGRNHVTWRFEPLEGVDGDTTYTVSLGGDTPSALVLPVVDADVEMPRRVPCPSLRGVPCR